MSNVERVAKAIHEARNYMVGGMGPWEKASDLHRETALFLAGAAIEAMGLGAAETAAPPRHTGVWRYGITRGTKPPRPDV